MCTVVCFGHEEAQSVGELIGLLPKGVELVKRQEWSRMDSNCCLCGVDVAETLRKAGITFEYDQIWDQYFIKAEKAGSRVGSEKLSAEGKGEARNARARD